MLEERSLQSKTGNKTRRLTYLEAVTAGLIRYASFSQGFAEELKKVCVYIDNVDYGRKTAGKESGKWLLPADDETALSRAVWLVTRINEGSIKGSEKAAQRLLEWKDIRPYEAPKQLIVGVAATSIPGLTLGRISRKKSMAMVVGERLLKRESSDLVRLAVRASHGVISRSLDMVGGVADRLDPDTSMWMYGDRDIKFYKAGEKRIRVIKRDLDRVGVPAEIVKEGDRPAVLALSPMIDVEAGDLGRGLESVS